MRGFDYLYPYPLIISILDLLIMPFYNNLMGTLMLLIGLTSLLIAIPLYSSLTPSLLTRITSIILLFSAALSLNSLYVQAIGSGLGLYSGLFHVTSVTQFMEVFLFTVGAFVLVP